MVEGGIIMQGARIGQDRKAMPGIRHGSGPWPGPSTPGVPHPVKEQTLPAWDRVVEEGGALRAI